MPRQLVLAALLLTSACAPAAPTPRLDPRSGLIFVHLPAALQPTLCPVGATTCHPDQPLSAVRPLWVAKTDVTVEAFQRCIDAGVCAPTPEQRDEPLGRCNLAHRRATHPMNCVTADEAVAFCAWIAARLPTALEWQYAAQSGDTTRPYPWGAEPVAAHRANYCDRRCPTALGTDGKNLAAWQSRGWIDSTQDDGFAATAPVGSYPAGLTPWGLADMAGNVWQWTTSPGMDTTLREVRGGSWDNAPASLRTTRRLAWPGKAADSGMGFRCVRPDDGQPTPA